MKLRTWGFIWMGLAGLTVIGPFIGLPRSDIATWGSIINANIFLVADRIMKGMS